MIDLASLKVCFLAGSLGQGGAERQLYYMATTLHEEGAQVQVLSLTQGEYWEAPLQAAGVPVYWVGKASSRLQRMQAIWTHLRAFRPHIVQSQHFFANLYATVPAWLLGLKEVGGIRNDVFSEVKQGGALLGRCNLWLPRVLAANSRQALANAQRLGVNARRLHFLPNVVDTDRFRPVTKKKEGPVCLAAIGRLVPQKRMDRFIDVLAGLVQQGLPVKGLIVGGERVGHAVRDQLQAQAKTLGLGPTVLEFKGEVGDITSIYQQADVLVLTSDWEGTPNVVLEAMAAGIPVVASAVGGAVELIEDGETGFLLSPDDRSGYRARLALLIEDIAQRERMGKAARQRAVELYSCSSLSLSFRSLYSKVLK